MNISNGFFFFWISVIVILAPFKYWGKKYKPTRLCIIQVPMKFIPKCRDQLGMVGFLSLIKNLPNKP